MNPPARFPAVVLVTLVYCVLATAVTWPLATNLTTALPGDIHGDTGVYVWNLWVFSHEWFAHAHLPVSTDHIFASTGGVDFSLHNYTPLAALAAVPLIPRIGLVGAYNVVLLTALISSALGAYALARHCGISRAGALVAGAVFAALPMVIVRTVAHLSLVTNAALPLFVLALFRALERPNTRRSIAVGAMVAIACYSDAYYGVFCVLMGMFILWYRFVAVIPQPGASAGVVRRLDRGAIALALLAAASAVSGRDALRVGGVVVTGLAHPYSVVALATALVLARLWMTYRPRLALRAADHPPTVGLLRAGGVAVVTCLVLLSPVLAGLAWRWQHGQLPTVSVFWRSSPRGVDLLAYAVPNPTHRWLGEQTSRWLLPPVQDAFPELVASCSLTLLIVLLVSHRRRPLPRMWLAFTGVFGLLSLGPFVHVAGANTLVPGPWALLRYVPVIGMVRSPSRFAIVAGLGMAMLAGAAVHAWLSERTAGARVRVAAAMVVVGLELLPWGRPLFPTAVPSVFRLIAAADESGRVLMLPTGIRDGTSSMGDFDPSSSYYQTAHQHPVLGGYVSRVSEWRRAVSLQDPVLRVLYAYSGASQVDAADRLEAVRQGRAFVARSCVAWVVLDRDRASPELRAFATEAFDLVSVHADTNYELMAPNDSGTCAVQDHVPATRAGRATGDQ